MHQKLPAVTLYIRRNSQPRQQYERVDLKRIKPIASPDVYCLHFYDREGKRKWQTVSTDLRTAIEALQAKQREWLSEAPATPATPKPSPDAPLTLEQQREAFIRDKKTTFKKDGTPLDKDTIRTYEVVTEEFIKIVKWRFATEVTKQDLKDWIAEQRTKVSHRTVCNLYISVVCFLHFCGVDHKRLLPQSERPAPIEETPEAYTQGEMTKFFFACVNEKDNLFFEFLLKTGPREREATHLEWTDLSLGANPTVKFQTKEGFRTKTGKSRVVPLERGLADKLTAWREKNPDTKLVFGREGDKVEGH
jgi:Phage integrase family